MGHVGEQWYAELDGLVAEFEQRWNIIVGDELGGGTHAFVAEATTRDGQAVVLKIALPKMKGSATGTATQEIEVLLAGQGRGYVTVFAHDTDHRALLMERLGADLEDTVPDVDDQIEIICSTLCPGAPPPTGLHLTTGAEKALWLHRFVEDEWNSLGRPCSEAAVRQAQAFADQRAAAHEVASAVLVHGDAHESNLLLAADGSYRLIDPDPMVAEPAVDLSVPIRGWNAALRAGRDPAAAAVARCRRISQLTGVDPQAIWEWGFMERLSTALYTQSVGTAWWPRDAFPVVEACVGVTSV
ncbi:MAG: phosphotransferase [Actinobacteria bacterium]|nr:phosphotransferase [Actinomycetota bacterium]